MTVKLSWFEKFLKVTAAIASIAPVVVAVIEVLPLKRKDSQSEVPDLKLLKGSSQFDPFDPTHLP